LSEIPVFECDSTDPASLERMTAAATVVISAAGPFNQFGMPLIDACVKTGTHYVDITGEPLFVERTLLNHHAEATKKGITIVNCCGFDCVPSDLSVAEILKRVPNVTRIDGYLRSNAHINTGIFFGFLYGFFLFFFFCHVCFDPGTLFTAVEVGFPKKRFQKKREKALIKTNFRQGHWVCRSLAAAARFLDSSAARAALFGQQAQDLLSPQQDGILSAVSW